jgi:hypothetical protein
MLEVRHFPRRRSPSAAVRLLAVTALLLAAWFVLAVVFEAREPGPVTPAPHIQPLPRNFLHP